MNTRRLPALAALALLVPLASACDDRTTVTAEPEPSPAFIAASSADAPASAASAIAAPATPLSAPLPAGRAPVDPKTAAALLADAEGCFADPNCAMTEAEARYRRADDAGAAVSCYRFYYGIGVAKDLPRARACLERSVAADRGCRRSSPDLERLFLAAMLIDAQGGPADPARVDALFADCFADVSVTSLREERDNRKALDPARTPLDFCKDIGGTTLSIGACHVIDADRAKTALRSVDKALVGRLDPEGKRLVAKARETWAAFARKEAAARGDRYRGGSLQSNAELSARNQIDQTGTLALEQLFTYTPKAGDPKPIEREVERALREVKEGDAEHQRLWDASQAAWRTHRDAWVALHVHLFGARFGKLEVMTDVQTRLAEQRKAMLEEAAKP